MNLTMVWAARVLVVAAPFHSACAKSAGEACTLDDSCGGELACEAGRCEPIAVLAPKTRSAFAPIAAMCEGIRAAIAKGTIVGDDDLRDAWPSFIRANVLGRIAARRTSERLADWKGDGEAARETFRKLAEPDSVGLDQLNPCGHPIHGIYKSELARLAP